jgi:hypothetical protein
VVLRGKQGTGKSFFAQSIGRLLGDHYMTVSEARHLVGNFNAHLSTTVLLLADEAFYAGDKRHESVLKMLITERYLNVEAKGVDVRRSPNCIHLIMASNEKWVVPVAEDDRRFLVLDIGESSLRDEAYFSEINQDLENGGFDNLLHYFLNYDISNFRVRDVPRTEAHASQIEQSMDASERWLLGCLEVGCLIPYLEAWYPSVHKGDLYDSYSTEMRETRARSAMGRNRFYAWIADQFGTTGAQPEKRKVLFPFSGSTRVGDRLQYARATAFSVGTLVDARNAWETRHGRREWPQPSFAVHDEMPKEEAGTVKAIF